MSLFSFFFFFFNKFYLFIYLFIYLFNFFGCIGSSLLHVGFLQLWQAGATLRCSAHASHCSGFSCGAWALGVCASVVVARRFSSCGTQAELLRGMWDLPRPGIEPMFPALAGGFLTAAPPGKSQCHCFLCNTHLVFCFQLCLMSPNSPSGSTFSLLLG